MTWYLCTHKHIYSSSNKNVCVYANAAKNILTRELPTFRVHLFLSKDTFVLWPKSKKKSKRQTKISRYL